MTKTALYLIAAAILLGYSGCGSPATLPPVEVGDLAPAFSLTEIRSDQRVTNESLKGDDIVLLNFWSTTCLVCMKEIDDLQAIHSDGKAKVVGIVLDGTPEQVKKIVDAKGIEYPVLAGNEEVFTQYDGYSIPYTLVLDSQMTIRKKFFGRMESEEFDRLITTIKNET